MKRARRRLALLLAASTLVSASLACGEEVVLRSGKRLRGYPIRQGREIRLNEYGCSAPAMTLGVRRLRAIDVKAIRSMPPADGVQRRLEELAPTDVARRIDLLREAQSARLRPWIERLAAEILAVQPKNAEALAALRGEEKWQALRRGNPRLDASLAREVRRLIRLESGADRRDRAVRLQKTYGYEAGTDVIERMERSLHQVRGLRTDIPLRMGAEDFPGAKYSLYVPAGYDPLEPRPLLVALHGGGIMFQKGRDVRGSAKDALALYLQEARRLGWFLLCPTAIEAPWTTSKNMRFLGAALAEVTTLWNIDLERIHLAGQSGGGDGAYLWAARKGDRFASVSIAAASKPVGAGGIAAKTALWIYHGEGDEVVPIAPTRKVAAALLRQKADFVYCELPREPHGLAPAARRDMFRFIAPKRRRRTKTAWPVSSFSIPSSKAALAVFGDPASAWGIGLPEDADGAQLVAILAAGRTDAEHAARRLVEGDHAREVALLPKVRAILKDATKTQEARVWAAWLLGRVRDAAAVDVLGDTLRSAKDERLLRASADAVGRIGSEASSQDLRWALADLSKRFRSIKGKQVTYQAFERTCRLGAAIAGAISQCVKQPDEFFPEMEENIVRHVLMDRRPILAVARNGEDPSEPRSALAEAVARAYRKMKAERTLFDMLRSAVKDDPAATRAVLRGMGRR